jgi:UDP-N-acetylmuramate dehydrogenase
MNMAEWETRIEDRGSRIADLRGELRRNEPMSRHTTWKAGGIAERCYLPADCTDMVNFLRTLQASESVHVFGLGSNLLVRDGGIRGTVVLTHGALKEMRVLSSDASASGRSIPDPRSSFRIYAEAGVASPKIARFAALQELAGGEFLAGIPGTMGGALAMNAGCWGSETWERVARVLTVDRLGTVRERVPAEYDIGYRRLRLKDEGAREEFFLAAWLAFKKGNGQVSRRIIREFLSRRIATQPLAQPNAGSVFRNPPGDHAARLIEACGLKGRRIGDAMVSDKHANFIVNLGGAKAADIEALLAEAQATVLARSGVELQREVEIVGDAV